MPILSYRFYVAPQTAGSPQFNVKLPNRPNLARMIYEPSAASADTRLRQAFSPFNASTYCTSMPQRFTPPSACLASRLHAFATNLHESCGLGMPVRCSDDRCSREGFGRNRRFACAFASKIILVIMKLHASTLCRVLQSRDDGVKRSSLLAIALETTP